MNEIIDYFLEANLILLLSGAFYLLVLRKEKHFRLSRFVLLGIVITALVVPLIHLTNPFSEELPVHEFTNFAVLIPEALNSLQLTETPTAGSPSVWTWPIIALLLYGGAMVVLFTLFISQLVQLFGFFLKSRDKEKRASYYFIPTHGQWPTFSFFNMLFFDDSKVLSAEEKQKITDHELVHIQQKHSVDIILIELVKILFWINPLVWMLRSSIEEIHEYLADEKILKTTDKDYYSSLLAKMALKRLTLSVGLHFNRSIIIKRIEMMKTPKSKTPFWKRAGMIGTVALMVIVFSCNDEVMNDVMKTSSQMQIPAELESKVANAKKQYPDADFVYIETDKSNEAKMNEIKEIDPQSIAFIHVWSDKERIGLLVNNNGPLQKVASKGEGGIFQIVEDPASPKDGYEAFYSELSKNIIYTKEARAANAEGTVYIQFIVDKDGSLTDAQVVKGIGYGLDEVALNAIQNSGEWNPPYQKGEAVRQRIVLPIKFSLDNPKNLVPSSVGEQ